MLLETRPYSNPRQITAKQLRKNLEQPIKEKTCKNNPGQFLEGVSIRCIAMSAVSVNITLT